MCENGIVFVIVEDAPGHKSSATYGDLMTWHMYITNLVNVKSTGRHTQRKGNRCHCFCTDGPSRFPEGLC